MKLLTDDIVVIGCYSNHLHPEMVMVEEFAYYDGPLSYVFRIGEDEQKFHAELVQTFKDNASVWVVTEYRGELNDIAFDEATNLRTEAMKLIAAKEHKILTVDFEGKIVNQRFAVKGSYPYSLFDTIYHMDPAKLGKPELEEITVSHR